MVIYLEVSESDSGPSLVQPLHGSPQDVPVSSHILTMVSADWSVTVCLLCLVWRPVHKICLYYSILLGFGSRLTVTQH